MVLHAVTLEDRRGSVVAMDGTGYRDGPLWLKEPVTQIQGYVEMIHRLDELLSRHLEDRAGIEGILSHIVRPHSRNWALPGQVAGRQSG